MGKFINSLDKLLLSNPTMLEYTQLEKEERDFIDFVVKDYVKPNSTLRVRKFGYTKKLKPKEDSFWNLEWGDITLIKNYIKKDNLIEVFKILYGVSDIEFLNLDLLNVFSSFKWVTNELERIYLAEKERLHSELTPEEKDAGAEELQEYGYYIALRSICPDLLEQDKYLKLKYHLVFRELACAKLISDVNRKYQQNAARKNKVNSQ